MASVPLEPRTELPAHPRVTTPSLPEVHASIAIPIHAPRWRRYLAFVGPGFLVAVGYMDPGNWATDLAGGAQFGYLLLLVQPNLAGVAAGFLPRPEVVVNPQALYIAIGILGATVMPHNLYLHSSIVQTRNYDRQSLPAKREAIQHATIESSSALMLAL